MESLIFSLTHEQYKKYLEIMNNKRPTLDFDFTASTIEQYSIANIKESIDLLIHEGEKILKLKKSSSFFSEFSRDEISKLVPIYYEVIDNISKIRSKLYSEIGKISSIISEIDKALSNINDKYSEFLPYKAALSERCEYSQIIAELDDSFKKNFACLNEQKENEYKKLLSLSTLCDVIIPDLLSKSTSAADSPSFKRFNEKEFFLTFDAFLAQINNV